MSQNHQLSPNLLPTAHAQSTQRVLIAGWVDGANNVHEFHPDIAKTLNGFPVAVVSSNR